MIRAPLFDRTYCIFAQFFVNRRCLWSRWRNFARIGDESPVQCMVANQYRRHLTREGAGGLDEL